MKRKSNKDNIEDNIQIWQNFFILKIRKSFNKIKTVDFCASIITKSADAFMQQYETNR